MAKKSKPKKQQAPKQQQPPSKPVDIVLEVQDGYIGQKVEFNG